MKNFQIKAVPENIEDKINCSLVISYNKNTYATIWGDGKITFAPDCDFDFEEVEYFLSVSKMFYSFFNNVKTQ